MHSIFSKLGPDILPPSPIFPENFWPNGPVSWEELVHIQQDLATPWNPHRGLRPLITIRTRGRIFPGARVFGSGTRVYSHRNKVAQNAFRGKIEDVASFFPWEN